ncbi:MAG: hypothetical protein KGI08_10440 [Thaumarchaeota archaeon]|nr:hypothetical protein [Nitrososphaerota archaeon]
MLLTVLDSNSVAQNLIVKAQEAIVDASGTIAATGVAQTPAAASATRSGFFFQNLGSHDMWINELGVAMQAAGSILVPPRTSISLDNYPVSTGAISVIGTATDTFTLRTW